MVAGLAFLLFAFYGELGAPRVLTEEDNCNGVISATGECGGNSSDVIRSADRTCELEHPRIVSVADLHGDIEKTKKVLLAASVIDESEAWIAGESTTLVQTGDMVDRGPNSLEVVQFFRDLSRRASLAGGRVVNLLGNHEIMLLDGSTYFVNKDELKRHGGRRNFWNHFASGSDLGDFLRALPVAAILDRTLFAHAGVEPSLVSSASTIDEINSHAHTGMRKPRIQRNKAESDVLNSNSGPVWTRAYNKNNFRFDDPTVSCRALSETLDVLNVDRMVIGHNVQRRLVPQVQCGGRLLLMDVGMSKEMYDADPVALEIRRTDGCQQELRFIGESSVRVVT